MHIQVLSDTLKLSPTQLWVDCKAAAGEEGAGSHTWELGGCQGNQVDQAVGAGLWRRDKRGGVVRTGPGWSGLTETGFIAFVVLPEGYQPDGDGLQEWPDGRCELWRDAAVTHCPEEGLGAGRSEGQTLSFSKHLVDSYCVPGTYHIMPGNN